MEALGLYKFGAHQTEKYRFGLKGAFDVTLVGQRAALPLIRKGNVNWRVPKHTDMFICSCSSNLEQSVLNQWRAIP